MASLCSLSRHLARDRLIIVPLFGRCCAETRWSRVSHSALSDSPLYGHSAGGHSVVHPPSLVFLTSHRRADISTYSLLIYSALIQAWICLVVETAHSSLNSVRLVIFKFLLSALHSSKSGRRVMALHSPKTLLSRSSCRGPATVTCK
jgi:hypothetical protein